MWFVLFCLLAPEVIFTSDTHPFKGRVIENDIYKTPLYGASVYFPDLQKGVVTNLSGYFLFDEIPEGTHRLQISFVGYQPLEISLQIPAAEEPVYRLDIDPQQLDEVQVLAEGGNSMQVEQARLSTIQVTALPLTHIPRLMGEPDLIRIIQNLPGVKTESDFTGGFHVRGGRGDQNLILLDGVPVYNPWHLFGLFSAFNTEALETAELTKGVFPAKYGGRVSSLLDIGLQEGSERLGAGYLTVSPLSASFSYGRPLNQKTSYLAAFRRTYMDPVFWILNRRMIKENEEGRKTATTNGYHFYDLNLKLVHRFRPGLSLETAWFLNSDQFQDREKITYSGMEKNEVEDFSLGWKNQTGSLKLRYHTAQFLSESHAFLTFYKSANKITSGRYHVMETYSHSDPPFVNVNDIEEQVFSQRFWDTGLKQHMTLFSEERSTFHFGGEWMLHNFRDISTWQELEEGFFVAPGSEDSWAVDEYGQTDSPPLPPLEKLMNRTIGDSLSAKAHEFGAYASASIQMGNVSFHPGVRYEGYFPGGYHHLMPRANVSWQVSPSLLVSGGYGRFVQYVHMVGLDMMRLPTDRWFWSDKRRRPVQAEMFTLGAGYEFERFGALSIEGYYKKMNHLLSFGPEEESVAKTGTGNSSVVEELTPLFSSNTISGSGEAYGVELFLEKRAGTVTGWLGYTLSRTWNKFEELNQEVRFPARTDKRHDLQLFLSWDFAENWSAGALFNYKTGQPVTFSTGHYNADGDPLGIGDSGGGTLIITRRNNFRLPVYHRLDLNIAWKNRRFFKWRSELSLNVVNLYNRQNPLMLSASTRVNQLRNGDINIQPGNKYVNQLPVLPVLSLRIALGGDAK